MRIKHWWLPLWVAWMNVASAEEPIAYESVGVRGETINLETLRGQWVVVNFWATWCKPCRKEIPDLSELHDARSDIHVIGLAFEEVEADAILAFLEDYPATYPIALVDVFEPPEVFGYPMVLPTTVLIGPDGRKAKTFLGPITRATVEEWIDSPPDDDPGGA